MKKEIFLKFYAKHRTIIYPFIVGIASLALIVLIILPQLKGYFSSRDNENLIKNKIKILEIKAKELEEISGTDLQRKVQSALVAFPSDKDYTFIIGFLQKLSVESGVNLESVTLASGGSKNSSGILNFTVNLKVNAVSLSFDNFIEKIEYSQTVMKIGSLIIEKSQGEQISATLNIEVYYSPIPKTLGSIDSPFQKLTEDEEVLAEKLVANLASVSVAPINIEQPSQQQPVNLLPRGKVNPFE